MKSSANCSAPVLYQKVPLSSIASKPVEVQSGSFLSINSWGILAWATARSAAVAVAAVNEKECMLSVLFAKKLYDGGSRRLENEMLKLTKEIECSELYCVWTVLN